MFEQGRSISNPDERYALYEQVDTLLNLDEAEINGTFLTGLKFPGNAYFFEA